MTYKITELENEIYVLSDVYPQSERFFARLSKHKANAPCPGKFEMLVEPSYGAHTYIYYDTYVEGYKDFDWLVEEYCHGAIRV